MSPTWPHYIATPIHIPRIRSSQPSRAHFSLLSRISICRPSLVVERGRVAYPQHPKFVPMHAGVPALKLESSFNDCPFPMRLPSPLQGQSLSESVSTSSQYRNATPYLYECKGFTIVFLPKRRLTFPHKSHKLNS